MKISRERGKHQQFFTPWLCLTCKSLFLTNWLMMYTTPQQLVGKNSSGHSSNGITWRIKMMIKHQIYKSLSTYPFINPPPSFLPDNPLCFCGAGDSVPEIESTLVCSCFPPIQTKDYLWYFKASTRAPSFQILFIMSSSVFTIQGIWNKNLVKY